MMSIQQLWERHARFRTLLSTNPQALTVAEAALQAGFSLPPDLPLSSVTPLSPTNKSEGAVGLCESPQASPCSTESYVPPLCPSPATATASESTEAPSHV